MGAGVVRTVPAWQVCMFLLLLMIFSISAVLYLPPAVDWETFRPAARALVRGQNPYHVEAFNNPVWTLVPFIPFAFLPEQVGRGLLFVVAVGTFAYVAFRMGATPIQLGLFLVAPPLLHGLLNGNIEWLVLLGVTGAPRIGLFFVLIKPQVGLGIALFWLVDSFRAGGAREVVRVFTPVTVAFLGSFALFDMSQLRAIRLVGDYWNASLWPYSLLPGLYLLYRAVQTRNVKPAIATSPMLSPYALFHSWIVVVVAVLGHTRLVAMIVGAMWGLVIINVLASGAW